MQEAREITQVDSRDGSEKRLANLRPFQKGVSGNPGGRRHVDKDVRALALKSGPRAFERIVELIECDDERVALMAAKEVLDRAYGKAPAAKEDDEGSKGLTINIIRFAGDNGHQSPQQLDTATVSIRTLEAS